jgi:hypothetical protein
MLVLTKENKLQAKLLMSQARLLKHQQRQEELQKELDREK